MKKDFEYLDSKKVLKELKSSLNGLSEKEAKSRIKTYGLNELPKEKEKKDRKEREEEFPLRLQSLCIWVM